MHVTYVFSDQQLRMLEQESKKTQSNAYAKGTKENLQVQWALYFNFCQYLRFSVLPAQKKVIVLFIQFLTLKLTALSSIKNYVAGVKTLHELLGLSVSAFESVSVKLMWMGLDRTWINKVNRATPITPEMLVDIHDNLDLTIDKHLVFWTACLVGFFILARKSNLVPEKEFQPGKQLAKKHVTFFDNKVEISLHWMKTRRPHQEPIVYPLHKIPDSIVCPYRALKDMFEMIGRQPEEPCFMLKNRKPLTYAQFQKLLKQTLKKAGYKENFSSHGLRAGGVFWAIKSGVPEGMVCELGSWKSDAFLKYVENPQVTREAAGLLMRNTINDYANGYLSNLIIRILYYVFSVSFVFLDILIIADDTVKNVHMSEAEWIFLPEGQGLVDVKKRLSSGEWAREAVKIVVLITGQAEASAGHQAMANSVKNAMLSVRVAYPDAMVLLCAPLPRPRDGPPVLRDLELLSDVMHEECRKEEYYEYSSLGSYFYGKYCIAGDKSNAPPVVMLVKTGLMDQQGITVQGSCMVQKRLADKIKSANLYERFTMLGSKLITL